MGDRLADRQVELLAWAVVLAASAADLATTWVGLRAGLIESNPVAGHALTAVGPAGILAMKLAAVGVLALPSLVTDSRLRIAPPVALGGLWLAAAAYNCYLLLTV